MSEEARGSSSSKAPVPPNSSDDVQAWIQKVVGDVRAAVNAFNALPSATAFSQLMALPTMVKRVEQLSATMKRTTGSVLDATTGATSAASRKYREVGDLTDVCEAYETSFVDVLDGLLDAVDTYADVESGQRQLPSLVVSRASVDDSATGQAGVNMFYGKNVGRPQDTFEDRVDNDPEAVWVPRLKEKPNAVVPLAEVMAEYERLMDAPKRIDRTPDAEMDEHARELAAASGTAATEEKQRLVLPNAYQAEIEGFDYMPWQLEAAPEVMYGALDETPLTLVDSVEALVALEKKLEAAQLFAVDLEAHDYRSYAGFSCLMQISTRTEDFVVDSMKLRAHMHVLNGSFTNPRILKVFHGCDWDILWLQRDFGVYVVNCFDTGQAARVLEASSFGLKALLQQYCNVETDKKYQLADWRIRPLPAEMLSYARGDTHYLLYIYDRMKTDLIARAKGSSDLVREVLDRTRAICATPYAPPPPPTREASRRLIMNSKVGPMDQDQVELVWQLYKWRDELARLEDESVRYVLPNYMLVKIAEQHPNTVPLLLACCSPVPPLVRTHAVDLLMIIKKCCGSKNEISAAERIAEDIARARGKSPAAGDGDKNNDDAKKTKKPQQQKKAQAAKEAPANKKEQDKGEDVVVVPEPIKAVVTQMQCAPAAETSAATAAASKPAADSVTLGGSDDEDEETRRNQDMARRIAESFGMPDAVVVPEVAPVEPEIIQKVLDEQNDAKELEEQKQDEEEEEKAVQPPAKRAKKEVKQEVKQEVKEEAKEEEEEEEEEEKVEEADPDLADRPRLKTNRKQLPTSFKEEEEDEDEEEEEEEEEEGKEDFTPFDYSSAMQQEAATKFRVGSVTTKQQQKIVRKKRFERKKTDGTGEKLVVQQPTFEGKKRRANFVKGFSSLSKKV